MLQENDKSGANRLCDHNLARVSNLGSDDWRKRQKFAGSHLGDTHLMIRVQNFGGTSKPLSGIFRRSSKFNMEKTILSEQRSRRGIQKMLVAGSRIDDVCTFEHQPSWRQTRDRRAPQPLQQTQLSRPFDRERSPRSGAGHAGKPVRRSDRLVPVGATCQQPQKQDEAYIRCCYVSK